MTLKISKFTKKKVPTSSSLCNENHLSTGKKSSQQLSWNEFGWKGFVWNATKVFLLGFVWNITKVFSNVAAKPLMLKELFLKKKNWVCPLSWQSFWKEKIQKEKKTCERNSIKWRTKLNWFRTKSKVKKKNPCEEIPIFSKLRLKTRTIISLALTKRQLVDV